jgi:hypothetical protein
MVGFAGVARGLEARRNSTYRMRVNEGDWMEIGGYWAVQTGLQNWLVMTEKGDLGTVVGGISRMGAKWYAAYVFSPVHDETTGSYLGDSRVPKIVGWGDDLVGAATGFRSSGEAVYVEGDFADTSEQDTYAPDS